jgi:hypothetical protein
MLFDSVFCADSEYRMHFTFKPNYKGQICQIPTEFQVFLLLLSLMWKRSIFFAIFFWYENSAALSSPRIWWCIFLEKQIFSIIYYTLNRTGKILRTYYLVGKISFYRKTHISTEILIRSLWKFQGIYNF